MSRKPRKQVIRDDEVGLYHVWCRCVRRAWLCGVDPLTGKDFEYRKSWLEERLEELALIFAIDTCVFSLLSNHFHLLLRNRPDLAAKWSDEEVLRRWWQLCPGRREEDGSPAEMTKEELQAWLADAGFVAQCRRKLSSISSFMKHLNQWLARRANCEENVTGHFFEGRFGCKSLLDEGAILAAALYVDLNEIRAGLAATLETSVHSSAYRRILQQMRQEEAELGRELGTAEVSTEWLCPIDEAACEVLLGPANSESVRASYEVLTAAGQAVPATSAAEASTLDRGAVEKRWRHGFLPMSIENYLKLLDWTARQVVPGKSGAMDASLPPILERLQLTPTLLVKLVTNFDKWFRTAAGGVQRLIEEAARQGRKWLCGVGAMRTATK